MMLPHRIAKMAQELQAIDLIAAAMVASHHPQAVCEELNTGPQFGMRPWHPSCPEDMRRHAGRSYCCRVTIPLPPIRRERREDELPDGDHLHLHFPGMGDGASCFPKAEVLRKIENFVLRGVRFYPPDRVDADDWDQKNLKDLWIQEESQKLVIVTEPQQ